MNDLNIIDSFLATFSSYIDSGFGLLKTDVGGLTSILIGIDVTLAALFWVLDSEPNVLAKLIKKVLYIGTFAYILNNFNTLATIVYQSFSTLGLQASNNSLTADDLMKPGKLAGIGFTAAYPLLTQAASLLGLETFFSNFVMIVILLVAWLIVMLAFFVIAIQLFITVIEFKLTSLAGFVLVPFAFWNKSAFLAERVLGNVITSGIKVMVLAVIIGIGSTYFSQFTSGTTGQDVTVAQAMSLVLASLTFLGLAIFGPGIASGLVSGAPQLGAGATVGTLGMAAGAALLTGGLAAGALRAGGSALGAVKAASAMGGGGGGAGPAGAAASPPGGGSPPSGGSSGAASSASGGAGPGPKSGGSSSSGGGQGGPAAAGRSSEGPPAWARKMRTEAALRAHAQTTQAAIAEGDSAGGGANPDISQKE